tara:strand:+ start:1201 stop:2100 length:900 start_codon:yes stop_codon:yes gene_type:complete
MRKIFYILFVSHDESQASVYADKVKNGFPQIPINIDFATDGSKALEKFEKFYHIHRQKGDFLHRLVISDINMPVMDGLSLVKEIRKTAGSAVIFLLGDKDPDVEDPAVDFIETPIVNWTHFLSKIESLIPEEFRITYGMPKSDSHINKKLNEFSVEFIKENKIEKTEKGSEPVSFLPKYFEEEGEDQSSTTAQDLKDDKDTVINLLNRKIKRLEKTQAKKEFGLSKKRVLIQTSIEMITLGGLLFYTIYLFQADEALLKGPFYQFKYIMALITILAFSSYFFSKVFEKYFIKREEEKYN